MFPLKVQGPQALGGVAFPGGFFQQMHLPAGAAPGQGGGHVGQLQGSEAVVLLADGGGEDAALIPFLPQALGVGGPRHHPCLLPRQLDAGALP